MRARSVSRLSRAGRVRVRRAHLEGELPLGVSGPEIRRSMGVRDKVNARELKRFRQMLIELKRKLTNNIGSLQNDALKSAGETVDELSDVSAEHMADRGSENFARDLMIRILQDSDAELCDINVALEKIDAGTYGLCEACSKKIPKKRLSALPFARLCIECKQAEEQLNSAP